MVVFETVSAMVDWTEVAAMDERGGWPDESLETPAAVEESPRFDRWLDSFILWLELLLDSVADMALF